MALRENLDIKETGGTLTPLAASLKLSAAPCKAFFLKTLQKDPFLPSRHHFVLRRDSSMQNAWRVIYEVEFDSLLQISHWGEILWKMSMQINAPKYKV